MTRLFQRQYVLQIGTTEIKDLRCKFKVEASLEKEPNHVEIEVSNLNEQTRATAQKKGEFIQLKAGYPGNIAVIFQGDIILGDNVLEGPTWNTKIRAGDGQRVYQYAKVAISHGPNTSVADVLKALVKQVQSLVAQKGIRFYDGNLQEFINRLPPKFKVFKNGYCQYDNAVSIMSRMAGAAGFRFSLQNGQPHFISINPTRDDFKEQGVLLNPRTGLVGSPEHSTPDKKDNKPPVLKAKSLLQPQIKCGGLVKLESEHVNGNYYVNKCTHQGDTAGGEWYTEMELKPL